MALTGFMMNFCNKQFTATQYALLTSVMAVSRVILIAHAGTVVAGIGWNWFFIATVPLCLPGLLLLNRFDHWQTLSTQSIKSKLSKFDLAIIPIFVLALLFLSSDPIWQWLGMADDKRRTIALTGAFGVVFVVFIGMIRPYLTFGSPTVKIPRNGEV